jgi:acetolactate synthase-1/2/3 large subunit/5-guanidino-2-oxopentanoate decarboxylase
MLKDRGVETIFGIPGVHNVEMYRGIEEAGITHVLARHEQGAGFMADGYARATGKPGVAYVITGPGLCNIMTPMGQAYSDSVPMLVISSCLDEVAAKKGQLHQMRDQRAAAETVCDWSEEAKTADAAYELINRAFSEFASERARSKHIQVPIDVLGATADAGVSRFAGHLPVPRSEDVLTVAAAVDAAKRPLFLFGGGAARASEAARALLAKIKAASFTSYAGSGIAAADDPLAYGTYLARSESARVFEQADLVVVVGSELAETDIWREHLGHSCPMVRVDIDPSVLAQPQVNQDMCCVSDAKLFLEQLVDHVAIKSESDWQAKDVAAARIRWRAETSAERPGIADIVDELLVALPKGCQIFSDMTQFAYVGRETTVMQEPGLWHHPYGFGTLGYALPAAIGGKIGLGDAPVIAIAGDYGFQYTVQELGVAVELGLSLPIILWDNGKLKEIEDSMVNSQIAPNAVQALNPDFCKLAEAWGANSAHPKSLSEMQDAVKEAFAADGPTLIYVTPEIL